ncbi:MAG TPA: HAMP domain-containing sensor histidine kinase [Actinoplanes sp.]|nr:HAMP domain-containing sensor histidine kinase [Actinoplanes sp.]
MTRRLLVTYLSFALLILVGLEVPLGYLHHRYEQHQAFQQLELAGEVLAVLVDPLMGSNDRERIEVLAAQSAECLNGQVDIVDARGEVLASTHRAGNVAASAPDIRAVLYEQAHASTRTTRVAGVEMMSTVVPVHPGPTPHGAIRVSVPAEVMTTGAESFRLMLAAVGLLVLAAAAVIAFALARWISRPVRALELATRTLAEGSPLPPLPTTSGPPDLRRLATTFAATADRLHRLIASQRSFIGHASHQLKTPLAALRLRLENLEPGIAAADAKNLQAALTETDRLAQMVETLLVMARSEQTTLPRGTVRLARAVAERITFWTPLAASRAVRLVAAGPEHADLQAIPGAIDQIIDNLLSNALRAAPRGSTIQVTWRPARDPDGTSMTEIHVVDQGPGLTADQCARAMDPFWRAPGAANDGTGLGLSLVRKLAEVSGGRAMLRPGDTAGVDAVVILPAGRSPGYQRSRAPADR